MVVVANSKNTWWSKVARGAFAAVLLTAAGVAADRAGADIIKKEDTLRGITMTREECAAKPHTVWINVYRQDFCVRYYIPTAGGRGARPVVFMNGDSNGPISPKGWTWADPSAGFDVDTDALSPPSPPLSEKAKTHPVFLARLGAG